MPPKKTIPKIKLKTISNRDVLKKIANDENIKNSKLIKIFSHNHQKIHQLYSKNDNHIYNDDDDLYISIFPKMKKYNEICIKNIENYFKKKDENKNFLKQYLGFKKSNKEICNDEINFLYGTLLQKYSNKNFEFTAKFLSGEKLFKENGLLVKKKKDIDDYYHKEIKKNGENSKNSMRDLLYINQIFDRLEQKRVKFNSVGKNPLIINNVESRRKSCVADIVNQYKKTHAYKKMRREEGMAVAKIVMMKQKSIENDEKYIKNISKLIEKEAISHKKVRKFYPFSNNPISYIKEKNNNKYNENENNNTLFIINRYTKNNFRNTKSVFNSTNTNFKKLNKYKSAGNIYSSLYKDNDTTNSTFINNNKETKMTTFLSRNNNKDITNKRSSYKTSIDYSDFNDGYNTIKNNNYIMIDDTSKTIKKISPIKNNINSKNNINKQNNSKNKNTDIKKNINNDNSKEKLSITSFNKTNKTNFYNISSYSNLTSIKNERNSKKIKIRNSKLSFNTNDNKKISKFTISEDDFDKKDLSWNLYKKFVGLKYKLESNNNHKLDNFCNTFTSLPKIVNDKLNKSFILDEKIKETHHNYIKSLLETKIRGFEKDEDVSV